MYKITITFMTMICDGDTESVSTGLMCHSFITYQGKSYNYGDRKHIHGIKNVGFHTFSVKMCCFTSKYYDIGVFSLCVEAK